tara:strand:- start:997 stop:1377 length:381 start_codon:yes stop_codon:yes gene_type:complete
MSTQTDKNENYINNDIQTAGQLEAIKTTKQIQIKKEKKLCQTELEKLLKNISNSNNKYLASTKNKLKEWKDSKKEKEVIEMINKLIDYLNCQLNTFDKSNPVHKSYINRINLSKKRLITELKKINI